MYAYNIFVGFKARLGFLKVSEDVGEHVAGTGEFGGGWQRLLVIGG